MPAAGVKEEKEDGGTSHLLEFDSSHLVALAQLGPEEMQAEGGDLCVTGAVWLTEE